jgi:glycosyltransferase involved in cell wall biosynthesis
LVFQPYLTASGGGNVVAAYIIEALKNEYAVSILTWEPVDFDEINRLFGSSLKRSELSAITAPRLLTLLAKVNPLNPVLSSFERGLLLRLCKKMRNDFDVIISVNNEADFDRRGIQYFHEPPYWISESHEKPTLSLSRLSRHSLSTLFRGELRPWMRLCDFSFERMKHNLTLVNSKWTGRKLKEIYGFESKTVYPPVAGDFPEVPWGQRENGLVCIGRIIPSKNFETLIEITARVRRTVPEAHLHIIGTKDESRAYLKRLQRLAKDRAWLTLSENVTRRELEGLVTSHRYGIHGMVNEPFGIAVAEMMHAGCIVFVPRGGGQHEIIGADDRLTFGTVDEAVRKITRVMQNRDEQDSLRKYLRPKRTQFSKERFMRQIQQVVEGFADAHCPPDAMTLTRSRPLG